MKDSAKSHLIHTPFRSEAVCASLLESGIPIEHIKTTHKGSFKKSYSNDIEKITTDKYNDEFYFDVVINRDGIYDKLPEGLFHQTRGSRYVQTVKDAVDEHKKYKEEESQARKFFAPLEQMIFRYRIYTELAERAALSNIQNGKLNSGFYQFWNIATDLPETEVGRLLQMMPYGYLIKGDVEATATALSYILNKQVAIKRSERKDSFTLSEPVCMPKCRLGMDTVLGTSCNELMPVWTFTIMEISANELAAYVENEPFGRLLQRFSEIFIPLEVDFVYEFDALPLAAEEFCESILGYGCSI